MQKNKHKYHIPQPNTTTAKGKYHIPSAVLTTQTSDKTYSISFAKYMDKDCRLNNLKSGSYKKLVAWLKNASSALEKDEILRYYTNKPVINSNDYKDVFSGLTNKESDEMRELVLSDTNRLFYYIDDAEKLIYCRLTTDSHKEENKIKR